MPAVPTTSSTSTGTARTSTRQPETAVSGDIHDNVRAFDSLAQELIHAGVARVVVIRYNVYEAAPLAFFPWPEADDGLHINLSAGESATAAGAVDQEIPPAPDVGFLGRDETLLALARFPFSLRPGAGHRVQRADFSAALYPSGSGLRPTVYDAYPVTTAVPQEGEVTVSLGPDFKFAGAEASLANVD